MPDPATNNRALLGFDYGEARLGVAVGYIATGTTHPLVTLKVKDGQPDWQQVKRLIDEWNPSSLVVGLPSNMDGSDTDVTGKARKFGNRLNGRYNLPVHMVDERLTTRVVADALAEADLGARKHKAIIDQLAAQQILQTYLTELQSGSNQDKGDTLEPGH